MDFLKILLLISFVLFQVLGTFLKKVPIKVQFLPLKRLNFEKIKIKLFDSIPLNHN